MERLDYTLSRGGIERRISYQQAIEIIAFWYPATWEESARHLSQDHIPFRYTSGGEAAIIEYKGPKEKSDETISISVDDPLTRGL